MHIALNAGSLAELLGGAKKSGTGWIAKCPTHDDSTASLKIDDGEDGKLLVKCHAGCEQAAVVQALKDRGMWPAAAAKVFNITHRYPYTDEAGVLLYEVVRLEPKDFRQRRPAGDAWEWGVKGVRQVPYRLPEVLAGIKAGRTIFIVEGEKDADNLAKLGLIATTNAGGAGKWRPDWAPLFVGASVCILPDNDDPGLEHAHVVANSLISSVGSLWVVELPGVARKGDVSDWIRAGGDRQTLATIVADARRFPYRPPPLLPAGGGPPKSPARRAGPEGIVGADGTVRKVAVERPTGVPEPDVVQSQRSFREIWATARLDLKPSGWPRNNLDNAVRILEAHPALQEHFYWDEFHGAIRSTWGDGQRSWYTWTYEDTLRLTLLIQREIGVHDMADSTVERAVAVIARRRIENPVRAWFDSLLWDGKERLPTLMQDVWGAADDSYHAAVGRCFVVGIAARVYKPGCQVDTMPIFEGFQGIGKSQALAFLGGEWFTECHEQMTSKDFFQTIQGKLIVEISELHAFRRADVEKVKGVITCRVDRYRKSYGRDVVDHPRQCVFAGTTNRDDWHADDTGGRRFLPVKCGAINLELLAANRDQLFAEAVARFKRGEQWWDIPREVAETHQAARRVEHPWESFLADFLASRSQVTVTDVLNALQIELPRRTRREQMDAASCLKVLGWTKIDGWLRGRKQKYWVPRKDDGK